MMHEGEPLLVGPQLLAFKCSCKLEVLFALIEGVRSLRLRLLLDRLQGESLLGQALSVLVVTNHNANCQDPEIKRPDP